MIVEQEIRSLKQRLDLLENRDLDLNGRRITNAGRAYQTNDLLTLGQAKSLIESPEITRIIEQQVHTIAGGPFGIPLTLGDTNQQGASDLYADAQHIHASGLTTKGDLLGYSTTTTRVAAGTDGAPLIALASATNGVSYQSGWKGANVKTLSNNSTTGLFEVALTTLLQCGGMMRYLVRVSDGVNVQAEAGINGFVAVNKGGVYSSNVTKTTNVQALSSISSLAVTFSIATGANKITVQVNANSSLTPTSLDIRYFLDECSPQVVTFL